MIKLELKEQIKQIRVVHLSMLLVSFTLIAITSFESETKPDAAIRELKALKAVWDERIPTEKLFNEQYHRQINFLGSVAEFEDPILGYNRIYIFSDQFETGIIPFSRNDNQFPSTEEHDVMVETSFSYAPNSYYNELPVGMVKNYWNGANKTKYIYIPWDLIIDSIYVLPNQNSITSVSEFKWAGDSLVHLDLVRGGFARAYLIPTDQVEPGRIAAIKVTPALEVKEIDELVNESNLVTSIRTLFSGEFEDGNPSVDYFSPSGLIGKGAQWSRYVGEGGDTISLKLLSAMDSSDDQQVLQLISQIASGAWLETEMDERSSLFLTTSADGDVYVTERRSMSRPLLAPPTLVITDPIKDPASRISLFSDSPLKPSAAVASGVMVRIDYTIRFKRIMVDYQKLIRDRVWDSSETRLIGGKFDKTFPNLDHFLGENKFGFNSMESILIRYSNYENQKGDISVIGLTIAKSSLRIVGTWIIAAVVLFLGLHLRATRHSAKNVNSEFAAPWVGIYAGNIFAFVLYFTMLFPVSATVLLMIRYGGVKQWAFMNAFPALISSGIIVWTTLELIWFRKVLCDDTNNQSNRCQPDSGCDA